MTEFTPYQAMLGGVLIAIAALMMLLINGKITGISGIFAKAFNINQKASGTWNKLWPMAFIAGLILSPLLAKPLGYNLPESLQSSDMLLAVAGLLVGFGSSLGSGCTSGHGICGIGRFSKRSIVATCIFMLTAILTVFVVKSVI